MCTCMSLTCRHHLFGRTLDHDREHTAPVVIAPGRMPIAFRLMGTLHTHFAIIGTAAVVGGTPLFYEAANERGLSMAGLNFPGLAQYHPPRDGMDNIAPFEMIPWILAQCASVREARKLLDRLNVTDLPFSGDLPLTPMHWMLDDRHESLVIEPTADGLHVCDNDARVLTNTPSFPDHTAALSSYRQGNQTLPGGYDAVSRFIRAAEVRRHGDFVGDARDAVLHFMRLMASVSPPLGMVTSESGRPHYTRYTACIDTDDGAYYLMRYFDPVVRRCSLHQADRDGSGLFVCRPEPMT